MHTVFVYGTLKRGHGNHRLLEVDGVEYLGVDYLPASAVECVGFPMAKFDATAPVKYLLVEVYKVSDEVLKTLDRLEGYDPESHNNGFYIRKSATTVYKNIQGEVYEIAREVNGFKNCVEHEPIGFKKIEGIEHISWGNA